MRKRTSSSGPQGLGSGWGRSGASGAPGWGWGWGWACTGSGAPWPPLSRAPIVCKEKPLDAGELHATRPSRHAPVRPSSLTARAREPRVSKVPEPATALPALRWPAYLRWEGPAS